jgi:hypothetical protein
MPKNMKIKEYVNTDDKNEAVYKIDTTDEELKDKIYASYTDAEMTIKVHELRGAIIQFMPQLRQEVAGFLAYMAFDRLTQLKGIFSLIDEFADENFTPNETKDYDYEVLTASVRGRGLTETAREFLLDEGNRNIGAEIDFFEKAFEAMELGTRPEAEPELPEIVSDEISK